MLIELIKKDMLTALKAKDQTSLKVIRYLLSLVQYEEIKLQRKMEDKEIVLLIKKEVKKRREAIEMFKKGQRADLVNDEEKQISIVQKYLPEELSEDKIEKTVDEVIKEQEGGMVHPGKIIGLVMSRLKGQADGTLVSRLVSQKLLEK